MASREESIAKLKKEIEDMESSGFYNEQEIQRKKNLLECYEDNVFESSSITTFNKEDFLRPEYRQGGYFTSQDYYDKCDEFHKILKDKNVDYMKISRGEYIFLKKEFFKNTYDITWLPEEEQFLPGTNIDVHAERL